MTAGPTDEPSSEHRRNDPGRRDRIVETALDVIAEVGVTGASHRRIATAAGVPLGSMTYYFDGMEDLLRAAFTRFALSVSGQFERRMDAAANLEEAKQAVLAIITHDVFETQRDLVLTHELYTLAARNPTFRHITDGWMTSSRSALERHFDPLTARILDALIEGLTIHRALDTVPPDDGVVRTAIDAIVDRR